MEKTIMTMMMVIIMVVLLAEVVQGTIPAPPTPPTADFICPICGEAFYTYDELYAHFTTAHPTQPIDIIWE